MSQSRVREADLSECLFWIRATQLQITRFVKNLRTSAGDPEDPSGYIATSSDAHFLLIAAAHVERTLARLGRELETDRRVALRTLRDVFEHWEQHKDSFASASLPKKQSGKKFADHFPEAVPWNFKFDATGTWISVLRLEDLWSDLLPIEVEIEDELASRWEGRGAPQLARRIADPARAFPHVESKVLGIAMLTQDVQIGS